MRKSCEQAFSVAPLEVLSQVFPSQAYGTRVCGESSPKKLTCVYLYRPLIFTQFDRVGRNIAIRSTRL